MIFVCLLFKNTIISKFLGFHLTETLVLKLPEEKKRINNIELVRSTFFNVQ